MAAMKTSTLLLLLVAGLPAAAETMNHAAPTVQVASAYQMGERLGTVSFPVSCAAGSQAAFNRGVALLHDFWYEEARSQFERLAKSDPGCAMAHWGVAMSAFHQIWDRPSAKDMELGWSQMQKAQALKAGTARERAYIAALAEFYRPGKAEFPARVKAYSAAMGRLYAQYPEDVDAGAFYALSILAAKAPDDSSIEPERRAMVVLTPLFAKDPDNPGVVHYVIHSCDNPAMAPDGLAAANHYGEIAQAGPHAFHMPGHIYARLGLWQQDIASQLGSIAASQAAEAHGESGVMDEPHSYDFLIYAYLQSGQDGKAKAALTESDEPLNMLASMPGMGAGYMSGMIPYYRTKLPVFYALEMRDWKGASELTPVPGASQSVAMLTYWARTVADGHLHAGEAARANLAKYEEQLAEIRRGPRAYEAESTGTKVEHAEMLGWAAFAQGEKDEALKQMRAAADLQDRVGQGEVDIPAREMLADMLLESGQAREALAEYEVALKLSPNRLNGLYGAGRAAEAAGERTTAEGYYAALLKSTGNGADSKRPELAHARSFVGSQQMAVR